MNEEYINLCNKLNYNKTKVYANKMSEDKKDFIIEITCKSLNMHGELY